MFDETLENRIALCFEQRGAHFETKKMFGGVCFLVDGKMCVGIVKDSLMVRFDPARSVEILERDGAREMDFTKRPIKGYAFVDAGHISTASELSVWIDLALEFNPRAKSSRKEKKQYG
ncbi:MAG: TfoX/Sxy family protein [Acidobacteria bacterium]|nr:TfoX/Sxy family protein [Acidobacteriota bacterium]